MTSTHPCDACGGTGEPKRTIKPDSGDGRYYWVCGVCEAQNSREDGECQFCECGGLDCSRANCSDPAHIFDCPVCLGAGRFSDRMPMADAMADAATLKPLRLTAGASYTARLALADALRAFVGEE